jgi:ribonucleoside-triphosphate reductase
LFGSDEFTGSIGVVTLNLGRIGYLSGSKDEFYLHVDHLMDLAKESLETRRAVVERVMDEGLFPYTKRYLRHLKNHFRQLVCCNYN